MARKSRRRGSGQAPRLELIRGRSSTGAGLKPRPTYDAAAGQQGRADNSRLPPFCTCP
jgi:hypothetical protein